MSTLRRDLIDIKMEGKDYVLAFDMASIDVFKELTGKGVLQSLVKLNSYEDETVLSFIACCLREKENLNEPLGKKMYDGRFNLFNLMVACTPFVITIVTKGFPVTKGAKKSSKKK